MFGKSVGIALLSIGVVFWALVVVWLAGYLFGQDAATLVASVFAAVGSVLAFVVVVGPIVLLPLAVVAIVAISIYHKVCGY